MFKTKRARLDATAMPEEFTSSDVSRMSGVSLRQLQWWDEQKVVSPRHEGHKRLYSSEEVVSVTVIAELRRKGFSLQRIRRVLRFLQRELGRSLNQILEADSSLHLLTDGKNIYLEESNERIIDLFKGSKQPMFLICVTDQVRRISGQSAVPKKPVRSETGAARRVARAV